MCFFVPTFVRLGLDRCASGGRKPAGDPVEGRLLLPGVGVPPLLMAPRRRDRPELKGSIAEGPNQTNRSDQSWLEFF